MCLTCVWLSQYAPTQLLNPWPGYCLCHTNFCRTYSQYSQANYFRKKYFPPIMVRWLQILANKLIPKVFNLCVLFTLCQDPAKLFNYVPKIMCSLTVVHIREWKAGVSNADLVKEDMHRLNRYLNKFSPLWCRNSPLDACPFDLCIHVGSWKEKKGDMIILAELRF